MLGIFAKFDGCTRILKKCDFYTTLWVLCGPQPRNPHLRLPRFVMYWWALHIPTINDLHRLAGAPAPEHPLISIVRMEDIPTAQEVNFEKITYGFYSIGLKRYMSGNIRYGRQKYDFQEGMMGFTAPNQLLDFSNLDSSMATGWLLFFQPELLIGHHLTDQIEEYGFFKYEVNEALHLSKKEELSLENIFENIAHEYALPIDKYSKPVVLSNIDLILTYCNRYYNRQFLTRHEVDSSLLSRFERELKAYFKADKPLHEGIPSVEYFSKKLHLSANYLSDMLKSLTGKTTKEHIHYHLIEKAKNKLLATDQSIAEISFDLGFEYPQYFSRLFKKKTGMTPKAFREEVV